MPQLFTIGYEGADPDRFVTALKGAGVAAIADVRAVALSRKRGFSKNVLRDRLAEEKVGYRHFIELGTPKAGREAARAGDEATLRRIYCEEVLTSPQALNGLENLAEMARNQPICLLCFERDPARCHRRFIADRFAQHGFAVTDLFVV